MASPQVYRTDEAYANLQADALVIPCGEGDPLAGLAELDALTDGQLTRLVRSGQLTGGGNELTSVLAPRGLQVDELVLVGLGAAPATATAVRQAAGAAAKALAQRKPKHVVFGFAEQLSPQRDASAGSRAEAVPAPLLAEAVCGALVGCQGQGIYQASPKLIPFERTGWLGADEATLRRGSLWADAINLTRKLVNQGPSDMYPESFAGRAEQVASQHDLEIEIWDEPRLQRERCGALLAVGRGSVRPPRLVILRHNGGPAEQPPLALVGKGVTFDSGGLSLKPSDSMKSMKCDMAGAATVLGAMQAIAAAQLPVNVIGLMGLVENLVSGDAYKLGDVLPSRNGKTIEVLNTDAEGRLVLADVLDVTVELRAGHIVDLATLTGACVVALGMDVAGVMTNDQRWCDQLTAAAAQCGEAVWQLPMFPEFGEQIRSQVADIKNVGEGRWGGAITAAKFLEEFVQNTPWTHIDIAGPAYLEKPKAWLDAGGSGALVRTLFELAASYRG